MIYITDDTLGLDRPIECTDTLIKPIDAPPTSKSAVLSLDQDTTEANLILEEITGCRPLPTGVLALSIRYMPIDEASRRELILLLAFLTLYLTS